MEEKITKNIFLYDLSAIVNAGAKSSFSSTWNVNGLPTGGINKLISFIIKDMGYSRGNNKNINKIILCSDTKRSENIRRKVLPTYKGSRDRNSANVEPCYELDLLYNYNSNIIAPEDEKSIYEFLQRIPSTDKERLCQSLIMNVQYRVIDTFTRDMMIPTLSCKGYEADDIMYSIAASLRQLPAPIKENINLIIRSDDYDLKDIGLIYDNTTFMSVSGKKEYTSDSNKSYIKSKLVYGDTSDDIPTLYNYLGKNKVMRLYDELNKGTVNLFNLKVYDEEKQSYTINKSIFDVLKEPASVPYLEFTDAEIDRLTVNAYCIMPFFLNLGNLVSQILETDQYVVDEKAPIFDICQSLIMKKNFYSIKLPSPYIYMPLASIDNWSEGARDYYNMCMSYVNPLIKEHFFRK